MRSADKIRNLAIIAHVDHGKTTLIDAIFKSARTFRENARVEERVMDSNELEKERGITIRAKHCTVEWKDYLVNIVDTPGHADFSGEVERVLSMVDSALLLVDANEGPMPQTRYVLMRALRLGMRPIVIVNKVDRPHADPQAALEKTFDLFLELGASDEQADFPVLYGSGLNGWLVADLDKDPRRGMEPLFETIAARVPPPKVDLEAPFRMQVCTLAWSDYLGRIGCGRILQGTHKLGGPLVRTSTRWDDSDRSSWSVVGTDNSVSTKLWISRGLDREETPEVGAGDIVWLVGPEEITIGDTLSDPALVSPALPPLEIEETTVSMFFLVNSGPFSGQEGKAVTIRQLKDRIVKELRTNVAMRMDEMDRADGVKVSGRGELHLGILIEEMRREGMELCVSRPEVIVHYDQAGRPMEPIEDLAIDLPEDLKGVVMTKVARRKGELKNMTSTGTGLTRLEYEIPTRGLIGYRGEFLTDTRGVGIMSSRFLRYDAWVGDIPGRTRGSLVSMEQGEATGYTLETLQERGQLFISPMERCYTGMVVGENSRPGDILCNPTRKKHLTNHRSATRGIDKPLDVPRKLSLDQAIEWIAIDELVEVTPKAVRIRKTLLDAEARKRAEKEKGATSSAAAGN